MKEPLQENDALWDFLGRSRPPTPSPFFARNVLRSVRSQGQTTFIPAFMLRWLCAMAFLILVAGFVLSLSRTPHSGIPVELVEYFDIAAGLDQIASIEEANLMTHFLN